MCFASPQLHAQHALRVVLEDHLAAVATDVRLHRYVVRQLCVQSPLRQCTCRRMAVGETSQLLSHTAIREILIRFETPLQNIYCYYVSQGWLLSPEKQLTWEQVVRERLTMGYVDFLKFCSDYQL